MISKKLKIGDTIGIISPSGPISENSMGQFEAGVSFFKNLGFKVKVSKNAFSNTLKYSATPEEKADDINSMFADDEVKAIVCSQGGSNSNSILPLIDFENIKSNPKVFLGISDITVLLDAIYQQTGLVTFHGNDVIWGFGREYTNYDKQEFENILVNGEIGVVNHNSEWKCVREGIAEGILIGGNTSCITKLSGTKYFPSFNNKILFLEDYADSTPQEEFECHLYHLKELGVFEKIKGLWLGYYDNKDGVPYEEIAMNVLKNYDFPILKCDDFGHNTPNTIIPIGVKVRLDATNKQVVFLENYVE